MLQGPCPAQPAVRAGQRGHPGRDSPGAAGDGRAVRGAPGPDPVRGAQGGQAQARDAGRVSTYFA